MKINNVEYGGQAQDTLTYTIAVGTVVGDAVTVTGQATAGRGADAAPLLGKVLTIEPDSLGTVVKKGVIVLPYTGTLNPGYQQLAVNGAGKVKAGASGVGTWATVIGTANGLAVIDL